MKRFIVGIAALAVLSGCGAKANGAVKVSPVSAAPTSVGPVVGVHGIVQPDADCVTDGESATVGWKVYGWDNMDDKQTVIDWDYDVPDFLKTTGDGPLGVDVAWYCPPE